MLVLVVAAACQSNGGGAGGAGTITTTVGMTSATSTSVASGGCSGFPCDWPNECGIASSYGGCCYVSFPKGNPCSICERTPCVCDGMGYCVAAQTGSGGGGTGGAISDGGSDGTTDASVD
jgi:hypothetical protein